MKTKRLIYLLICSFLFLVSCLESPEMSEGIINGKKEPTVVTKAVLSPVNDGVLLFEGEITSTGKSEEIRSKGFYWSFTNSNPTEDDNIIISDSESLSFTVNLENVAGDTIVYWKAFAENTFGFDYGEVQSYTTPSVWERKADFIAPLRGFFSFNQYNNNLFLFGGQKTTGAVLLNETWYYDINTNRWRSLQTDFEGERRYLTSFVIGDTIYVGTGQRSASVLYNDFYCLDGNRLTWTKIETETTMEPRYESVSFTLNGKGYLVGGYHSSYPYTLKDVWQFNPGTEIWEKKENFPVSFTSGISIYGNDRAFVGFGRRESSAEIPTDKSLWEYDETGDSWTLITQLPENFTSKVTGGVLIKNFIYLLNNDLEIWEWNMNTMEWKFKTYAPEILRIETDDTKPLMLANGNAIYIGLSFSEYLFEYRPFWDNDGKLNSKNQRS